MRVGASSTKQLTMFVWTRSASTSRGIDGGESRARQLSRQLVIAPVERDRDRAARRWRGRRSSRPGACRRPASWPRGAPLTMKALSPARIAPTGPPRPLQSANQTESTCRQISAMRHVEIGGGIEQPGAVEMHGQCRARARRHGSPPWSPIGVTVPPAALCVFSRQISRVGASARSVPALMAACDVCDVQHAAVALRSDAARRRRRPKVRRPPSCRYAPPPRR